MTDKRKILFVDFDGTLIRRDSLFMFLRFVRRRRGKRFGMNAKMIATCAAYALRMISAGDAKCRLLTTVAKGLYKESFERICADFVGEIEDSVNSAVLKDVEKRRMAGEEVVIVSASVRDWLEPYAVQKGFGLICTEVAIDGNPIERVKLATPNCRGKEKVRRIERWLSEKYPNCSRCDFHITAIGNGRGDKEMFEFADEAISVSQVGD
ncbi:MAG: HAD-IB family phosphatase [Muribaculaceae bacterium]|nr:HAD-IB family phosphatase [Muribaculaceae bacterium]